MKKLESYVRLTDQGIEIGKSDSSVVQKSSNEKLAFVADGVEVASFGKDQMSVKMQQLSRNLRWASLHGYREAMAAYHLNGLDRRQNGSNNGRK